MSLNTNNEVRGVSRFAGPASLRSVVSTVTGLAMGLRSLEFREGSSGPSRDSCALRQRAAGGSQSEWAPLPATGISSHRRNSPRCESQLTHSIVTGAPAKELINN